MTTVISSVSTKGGSGKTSLVKHLGIAKSEEGYKVLIIDLCQNSDVATKLGYKREQFQYDTYDWVSEAVSFSDVVVHDEETGIDFVPASNLVHKIAEYAEKKRIMDHLWILKERIDKIKNQYDYVFLDNHPTETDKIMIMSILASDIALIPTVLEMSSIVGTQRTLEIIQNLAEEGFVIDYYIVPMAVDLVKGFLKELNELRESFEQIGITKFTSPVRYSTVIQRAGLKNQVINLDNPYMQKVMEDYRIIAREIGSKGGKK